MAEVEAASTPRSGGELVGNGFPGQALIAPESNGFNGFTDWRFEQAVETALVIFGHSTGLKPGANERLQKTEMCPPGAA